MEQTTIDKIQECLRQLNHYFQITIYDINLLDQKNDLCLDELDHAFIEYRKAQADIKGQIIKMKIEENKNG
jgi:hypothetical protein